MRQHAATHNARTVGGRRVVEGARVVVGDVRHAADEVGYGRGRGGRSVLGRRPAPGPPRPPTSAAECAAAGQPTLVHSWQPVVSKYSPLLTVTRPWPWMLSLAMIASNSPEAFLVRAQ